MSAPPDAALKPGAPPYTSRSMEDMHPVLLDRFLMLDGLWREKYRFRRIFITRTYSNVAAQRLLFAQGRTLPGKRVTNCDGTNFLSEHNHYPCRAVDVAVKLLTGEPEIIKAVVSWDVVFYKPLLQLALDVGLVSGGSWTPKNRDWPHLQLPPEVV